MAEGKKSFQLYTEWIEIFEVLEDDVAGRLIKHIFQYVNDQNPETNDKMVQLAFIQIKQQLKRDLRKWERKAQTNRENGSLGGRPKTQQNPTKPTGLNGNPQKPVEVEVEDKVKEEVKENKGNRRFTPPHIKEISEYFLDLLGKQTAEPEKFLDFYASKNWMVGKNKMKDWRAAIRNWIRRMDSEQKPSSFLNHYDQKFERTLQGQAVIDYHKHLIELGWKKLYNSGGTNWKKP